MTIDQLSILYRSEFFPVIGLLASLLILSLVLIYAYFVKKNKPRIASSEEAAQKQAEKIVRFAHERAEKLIEKAQSEASRILIQTSTLKGELDDKTKKTLTQTSQKYMGLLEEEARTLFGSYKDLFVQAIETYLKESQETLKNAQLKSEEFFDKTLSEELLKARTDIENYKREQINKIDTRVRERVEAMAKEILGKSLTSADHRQLILEALDEAKKKGMFNV